MPYYIRTADNLFREGLEAGEAFADYSETSLRNFPTRQEADAYKRANPIARTEDGEAIYWDRAIVFAAYQGEIDRWQSREQSRFTRTGCKDGIIYSSVPWQHEQWNQDSVVARDDRGHYYLPGLYYRHYAHLSTETPGQIAYTPSDEYGIAGRKVKTTPARYLDKYARRADGTPALSRAQIQKYVDSIKAVVEGKLTISQTADEAEQIYRNGPRSCMSYAPDHFDYGIHPARVYADPGDLRVAYFGPISKPTARAVVWPEKKYYGRLYGDTCLRAILERNGYSSESMVGARLPAIALNGGRGGCYLMPYVDGIDFADLVTVGKIQMFELQEDSGDFECQVTDGYTRENSYYCDHCERNVRRQDWDEDAGACGSCMDNSFSCGLCESTYYNDNSRSYCEAIGEMICLSCYDDRIRTCAIDGCHNEYDRLAFSRTEANDRRERNVSDICPDCADGQAFCDTCGDLYSAGDEACPGCERREGRDTRTGDLFSQPTVDARQPGFVGCVRQPARVNDPERPAGSLAQAVDGSFWQYPIVSDAYCLIYDCRRAILPSEPALRANVRGAQYYCQTCATAGGRLIDSRRPRIRPPAIDTPCECGCQYPARLESEDEIGGQAESRAQAMADAMPADPPADERIPQAGIDHLTGCGCLSCVAAIRRVEAARAAQVGGRLRQAAERMRANRQTEAGQ